MITLSKAFRQAIYYSTQKYLVWADITLANSTRLHLTTEQIWSGGFTIDDAVSSDSTFGALGSAVCNSSNLIINNQDESFSAYDFTHAEVILYVGMKFSNRTEKIKKGRYIVDSATYSDGLITLYCLDFMQYFDTPYDSSLSYPATLDAIVRDACSNCDILLNTYNFPHKSYVVQTKPDKDGTTYRDVIEWAATIAGCFARMNVDGKLELKWFDQAALETDGWDGGIFDTTSYSRYQTGVALDGGTISPWSLGDEADAGSFTDADAAVHHINALNSQSISVDDVIITGVRIKLNTDDSETKTYTKGSKGYWIEIEDNKFITETSAQEIADWLGDQLIGLTFRQASISHTSTPAIEAGDVALVWDRKGNLYPILVTRTNFSVGKSQMTVSAAETPSRNSSIIYDQRTKSYVDARKLVKREITERERALENLATQLAEHSGLYSTAEEQEDGSTIFYMHDKPDLADSTIIWKLTKSALGVSTDGGKHWNAGLDVNGDMITRILTTTGVNAEWINTGELSISKKIGGTLRTILSANCDTGVLKINAYNTAGTKTFSLDSEDGSVVLNSATVSASWNAINRKVQLEDGQLNIYDANSETSKNKILSINEYGMYIYRAGTKLGHIGTNNVTGYTNQRGIVFDLDYAGSYMTWASKDDADSTYNMKFTYWSSNASVSGHTANTFEFSAPVHHYGDIDMHNYQIKNATFQNSTFQGYHVASGGQVGTNFTYSSTGAVAKVRIYSEDGSTSWTAYVRNGLLTNT